MDGIRGPFYSPPIPPIGVRERTQTLPQRLRGKIVGVRAGRNNEASDTRILTIKLSDPPLDSLSLLNAEVELIIRPSSSL